MRDVDPLAMLAKKLVAMSRIAWQKHRLVQSSLVAAVIGALLVSAALPLP